MTEPLKAPFRAPFERLERDKAAMLARVSEWPAERASFRPRDTEWCALEVLDHLVKVERSFIVAVRKSPPDGHPIAPGTGLRVLMLNAVMRSPAKVKVPRGAEFVLPGAEVAADALARSWAAVRLDLAALLNSLTPAQQCCGVFQHPVSGWMNIHQGLAFLAAHLRHHGYQLERLKP